MRSARITVDPQRANGEPCIRGLGVTVAAVVELLADGLAPAQAAGVHAGLEAEDVRAALRWAAAAVRAQGAGTGAVAVRGRRAGGGRGRQVAPQRVERFTLAYFETGNGTAAFLAAYPNARRWRPSAVHSRASRLLRMAPVQRRLAELRAREEGAAVMARREALEVLSAIARGQMGSYLNEHGRIDPERVRCGGAAVAGFAERLTQHGWARSVVMGDRLGAIDLLARLQGWYAPVRVESRSASVELRFSLVPPAGGNPGECGTAELARQAEAFRRWQELPAGPRDDGQAPGPAGEDGAAVDLRTLAGLAAAERARSAAAGEPEAVPSG